MDRPLRSAALIGRPLCRAVIGWPGGPGRGGGGEPVEAGGGWETGALEDSVPSRPVRETSTKLKRKLFMTLQFIVVFKKLY